MANRVSGLYHRQPALDPDRLLWPAIQPSIFVRRIRRWRRTPLDGLPT